MNMSLVTIQEKSTDSRFPMNGKLTNIGNVHSVAYTDGLIIITYEDREYKMNEAQFKLENVSYVFIS